MNVDDVSKTDLKGAFILLNRDFQQFSQRVTEWFTDHDRRLTRGGERFAKVDLQQQRVDTSIDRLELNYARAMAEIERLQARDQELDRQLGATLRLANKVQHDGAALQGEIREDTAALRVDIIAIRAGLARLTTIVWGAGALVGAIEVARFALMRRKTNA